jgi:hypothetical protein
VAYASHYIVGLSAEIREAMDGGMPLDTDTWHPLRGFMLHEPAAVPQQATALAAFANQIRDHAHPLRDDRWTQTEVSKVAELFQHATMAGEAAVTLLDLTRTGKKRS